jgi:hypothetical protein
MSVGNWQSSIHHLPPAFAIHNSPSHHPSSSPILLPLAATASWCSIGTSSVWIRLLFHQHHPTVLYGRLFHHTNRNCSF